MRKYDAHYGITGAGVYTVYDAASAATASPLLVGDKILTGVMNSKFRNSSEYIVIEQTYTDKSSVSSNEDVRATDEKYTGRDNNSDSNSKSNKSNNSKKVIRKNLSARPGQSHLTIM